jgi:prepilin-type N-terminal cleavage/methylation domain-containing protein
LELFKNKNPLKLDAGFTLIEVLIAILILSFISISAYKMIDENTESKDRITTEDRNLMQTLTALNRIETDFNEFYSPLFSFSKVALQGSSDPYADTNKSFNTSFEGKTKNGMPIPVVTSEDKSTLIFLSQVNRRKVAETKESNFVWIKYSLKPTEDEENRKLGGNDLIRQVIAANPFKSNLNWADVKEQVVLSNLKSLEFNFYDERNKKWITSLSDLNENKNSIRSLKVLFTWMSGENAEQKFEKIFRVVTPYFNTKQDDLKAGAGGAWGGSTPPPGMPTPPPADDGNN